MNRLQLPLPNKAKNQRKITLGHLIDDSKSLILAELAQQHPGPTLIIAKDGLQLLTLQEQLAFFSQKKSLPTVHVFPDWETLPYDPFSPHPDILSSRLSLLSKLKNWQNDILLLTASTAMHRLPPPEFIQSRVWLLQCGDPFSVESLKSKLLLAGYHSVKQVQQHGEFSIRGSLIDVFPMGSQQPFRIDLFDNTIESLRLFDLDSQCSTGKIPEIRILPAHEFPLDEEGISLFKQQWRKTFDGNPMLSPLYQDISKGLAPGGIEYYFPLFFSHTTTLFHYLPQNTLIINDKACLGFAEKFWEEIQQRYTQLACDIQRPILPPTQLYLRPDELLEQIHHFEEVQFSSDLNTTNPLPSTSPVSIPIEAMPPILTDPRLTQPWEPLLHFIQTHPSVRIAFCAESEGRSTLFKETLTALGIPVKSLHAWEDFIQDSCPYALLTGAFTRGFYLKAFNLLLLPEAYLLGQNTLKRQRTKGSRIDQDAIIRHLSELQIGAPVVHLEHGIGRYQGLNTLTVNAIPADYVTLVYAGDDKLYVPVSSLNLISRYAGTDPEHAPLHRLGSDQWQKSKRKAREQVKDLAVELLEIYAQRAARKGFAFTLPISDYEAFSQAFPFEETDDQLKAINDVISDMTSERAMDRLVCGDVGFGKTEVAMRAAFIAVHQKKQVLVLVPTTLLAQQHGETFKERFANWPIEIAVLSRFQSKQEQNQILEKLKNGRIDIVIGTHRLLQKDLQCQNLGLLIIDEEHRFGVQQKEKLKQFRAEVDMLALTATPIPRTLNLSLSGIRDLSVIATAPEKRLSIKTFVREKNMPLIREAILREIFRGGQVYYLHNEVETIEPTLRELQRLIPEAQFAIAHGQMHERELEKIMNDFYHRRFHVLLCTTIIETGIDVPSANTIIINKADRFGLAQLHQLRGRVGRSHHQAYAYLMVHGLKGLTPDAKKRLDAISALEELGAGFTLAMQDMEIRGAGELLGESQSGSMESIGFSLYMEMLEEAVEAIKTGRPNTENTKEESNIDIDLQLPALLPDAYIGDVGIRLTCYKRLSEVRSSSELDALQVEFIDRFGPLPPQAKHLFTLAALRLSMKALGIKKIEMHEKGGRIEFLEQSKVNVDKLLELVQNPALGYQLDGPNKLRYLKAEANPEKRIQIVNDFLLSIS